MYSIQQAAFKAGISAGLLHLWISTGKVKPSLDLSISPDAVNAVQDSVARKAIQQWAHREETTNWIFTDADIVRLRKMVEQTADKKSKTEITHVKGADYTVQELAALWGLGVDKIRELFANEPDVKKIQSPSKKGKRHYVTLRIPERVAERVQRRLS